MEIIKSPIIVATEYHGKCDVCDQPLYFERLVLSFVETLEDGRKTFQVLGMSSGNHYYEHSEVRCNGCGLVIGTTTIVELPEGYYDREKKENIASEAHNVGDR